MIGRLAGPRKTPDPKSRPITPRTFERLLVALEKVYPGKVRRAVDVMPAAVNKTIDNEEDALETIARVEAHFVLQGIRKKKLKSG